MHTQHKLFRCHEIQVAVVFLKAEDCPCLLLSSMAHEMNDELALVSDQGTDLFDGRGTSPLKGEGIRNLLDNFFETHPFAIDVE